MLPPHFVSPRITAIRADDQTIKLIRNFNPCLKCDVVILRFRGLGVTLDSRACGLSRSCSLQNCTEPPLDPRARGSTSWWSQNTMLSGVSQNQPVKVESKGFKTSHFLGQKTAPRDCPDAGPMGMSNVLKVSLQETICTLHDRGWSRRRIARELGIDRTTVGRYLRPAKPAISTTGSEEAGEVKPAISTAGNGVGRKSQCEPLPEVIMAKFFGVKFFGVASQVSRI
jgi:hypothetical protein